MTQRDYYQVLGVARDSSPADIRAAFTRLARLHHPDSPGNHHAPPWRLQEVQIAYRCLSDRDARDAHDRALDETERNHVVRQRRVQRRLYRYDHRHPHPTPRPRRPLGWKTVVLIAIGAALVIPVAQALVG